MKRIELSLINLVLIQGHHAFITLRSSARFYVNRTRSPSGIKTYGRVLAPGLILLDPKLPDHLKRRNPLATAWRQLDGALDDFTNRQLPAARKFDRFVNLVAA